MAGSAWSQDRIATLKTLWTDGLSASQVAKQLGGVTRNAVIGKIHRLGLSRRAQPPMPAQRAREAGPRAAKRSAQIKARTALYEPFPPSRSAPLPQGPGLISSMTDLGLHVCKWPIGDPKARDFSFCGRSAIGPYCPTHKAQAVRPGAAWRADRDASARRVPEGRAA